MSLPPDGVPEDSFTRGKTETPLGYESTNERSCYRGRELSLPRGLIASFESIALKTGGWKSRMSVRRMMQVWAAELGVPESVDGSALRTATK
jgi:hypothetical protein